jgi:hypothetical protein
MNKRGARLLSEQMFILFEIILIGLVLAILMAYVMRFGSTGFYESNWISHDLKMIIETLQSSPHISIYNFSIPKAESINQSNSNFTIEHGKLTFQSKLLEEGKQKIIKKFVYPDAQKFSGAEGTNFTIIVSRNEFSISPLHAVHLKQLACENYKQLDTKNQLMKKIRFNKNPANERIVDLLEDYFKIGKRAQSYELVDSGYSDLYLHIECSVHKNIVINRATQQNQKFACLIAEKVQGVSFDDILQKPDTNLAEKEIAVRLDFNCNQKQAASIGAAVTEFFEK